MEKRYEQSSKVTIQSIVWNIILTIIKTYNDYDRQFGAVSFGQSAKLA